MEKIKKAVRIFNVTENVTDIGTLREQRIDGLNEFTFICEDTLLGLRVNAAAVCPELDASDIAADTAGFIGHAA